MRQWIVWVLRAVGWIYRWPSCVLRNNRSPISTRIAPRAFLLNARIGEYCYIGHDTFLLHASIGNYCSIAAGVMVGGMEHSWWWGSTSPALSTTCVDGVRTIIGEDVWIGAHVIIRQGVMIGRGAVVGAGSVVLRDVEPYTIVAGVPARVIRKRFSPDIEAEVESSRYWTLPPGPARARLEQIPFPSAPTNAL